MYEMFLPLKGSLSCAVERLTVSVNKPGCFFSSGQCCFSVRETAVLTQVCIYNLMLPTFEDMHKVDGVICHDK